MLTAVYAGLSFLGSILKQPDPQVLGLVNRLPIGHQDAVRDPEDQTTHDDALEIELVGDLLDARQHLAAELHFADTQRATAPGGAEPTEKEPDELPERVQAETARHDRIAFEMAAKKPQARLHIEFCHDLPLAMSPAFLADVRDAVEHQHRRKWKLGVAGAEQ